MNMPPARANIQRLTDPIFPTQTPTIIPNKQRNEDTQLYITACFTDIPARNNTAKSPARFKRNSYGRTSSEVMNVC